MELSSVAMHQHQHASATSRGFTIVELLVAILVIGLLAGLIIVGVRAARGGASQAVAIAATNGVKTGVESFKKEVGFLPPLLKDRRALDAGPTTADLNDRLANLVQDVGGRNVLQAYSRVGDAQFLRAYVSSPDYLGPTPDNQFRDNRYSEVALGVYLAGAFEEVYGTAAPTNQVVMDGVPGPGMYKPTRDGTFEVAKQALAAAPADRKQVGATLGAFVEASGSLKILVDRGDGSAPERNRRVLVMDRNNVPLRYYRWLNGRQYIANGDFEVRSLNDVRVPPLVGRFQAALAEPATPAIAPAPGTDTLINGATNPLAIPLADREPERLIGDGSVGNQALKTAAYAIVAAGNNKVFGDEPIAAIAGELSVPVPVAPGEIQRLRELAASDNIVRVGEDAK